MPFPYRWPRNNSSDLARYVTDDVWLPLGRALPAPDTSVNRLQIVESIYNALRAKSIRYTPERYDSAQDHQDIQIIRCPAEIFGEGVGTCLDLATLFCGLCLRNELSPVLVVLEGHALVAVSSKHSLREWDAYSNQELQYFDPKPLENGETFARLVNDGKYILVECTGFAALRSSPNAAETYPETTGRENDGTMSFDRAVAAGREQLDCVKRPFRFALDIAIAHFKWGLVLCEYGTPQIPLEINTFEADASGENRFLFRSRAIDFVGRQPEQATLAAFLAAKESFSWIAVTGAGGTGKSRLAFELCLECKRDWRAGFVPRDVSVSAFSAWNPNRPTLIVIDYVASRSEQVGNILRLLARRQNDLLFPVRVILLERESQAPWVAQLFGAGGDRQLTESCAFRVSPAAEKTSEFRYSYDQAAKLDSLELKPIASLDLWLIISAAYLRSGQRISDLPQEKARIMAAFEDLDPGGRPLFAALFGDAIAAHPNRKTWDRRALIRDVLDREEQHYWRPAQVTDPDKDLLALATMAKGIALEDAELPSEVRVRVDTLCNDSGGPNRYRTLSGHTVGDMLAPLEPDMLGEIFVLRHYERRTKIDHRAGIEGQFAWTINPAAMSEFLGRAAQDFPDHPTLPLLAEWHDAPWPQPLYWITAAYYIMPALKENGWNPDPWKEALQRCYHDVLTYLTEQDGNF